jgi:hypothetical protein
MYYTSFMLMLKTPLYLSDGYSPKHHYNMQYGLRGRDLQKKFERLLKQMIGASGQSLRKQEI